MRLRTFLSVVCLATVSGATTFTVNLKTLRSKAPASAWVATTLKGCGSFEPVTGSGAIMPMPISLHPGNMSAISATIQDEAGYTCGTSTATPYYHVTTESPSGTVAEADYDITGSTLNLNSATPKPETAQIPVARNQWKGAWSASSAYVANDAITYSRSSYYALAGSTNVTPDTHPATRQFIAQARSDSAGLGYLVTRNNILNLLCDGTSKDTAAMGRLLASAGSTGAKLILPRANTCLLSTMSFPANITLDFTLGGATKVATGQTVTILGNILASQQQIFSNLGAGQGALSFAGNRTLTTIYPLWFGLDCSGVGDNAPIWSRILAFTGEDTTFVLPNNCVDKHASTVTVSSRAGFKLMSSDRVQNGGGNQRPQELWTGSSGGMWDFQANQAATIEGFLFTNTTNLDYYLRFDGNPGARIGTEELVRYNTFTSNTNNAKFSAISINTVSGQNHEKNIITDNDFFCSQSKAFRESDSGQITSGSRILTCGLSNCTYTTDASPGDRIRVSYASGILDTTIASITDNNRLEMAAAAGSNQTGARVHFRQAYGNGITIGSVNAKHNTFEHNSFTQCARGLNVTNGSFSSTHMGGSANDVLAYISNIAEASELAYLEDENSLRDVYTGILDSPLTLSHLRNSEGINGESDGFIYFSGGARVTITGSLVQDTPKANSVLIGAPSPGNVQVNSIGNQWSPGVMTMANLGFTQWRTVAEGSSVSGGFLVSCGDYGITDAPGACFQFGEGGATPTEGHIITSSGHPNNSASFNTFTAEPNVQSTGFVNEARGFRTNFNGFNNSTSMNWVGFDAAFMSAVRGGNSAGYRFTMPIVNATTQPFSRGLWVAAPTGNTLIGTGSGVYVEDLATHTGITNRYSFFGAGATDKAHFGGPLELGGPFIFLTDNAQDIGETGANRPRDFWLARNADVVGNLTVHGSVTSPNVTLSSLAAPTCDAAHRGQFNYVAGGAGVKDMVQVCGKDAADVYAWRTIY